MKKQNSTRYLSSLYEISLNIGNSLALDRLLSNALSSYISHLDCSGGIIFESSNEDLSIIAVKPKILKKQNDFLIFLENSIKNNFSDTEYIVIPCPSGQYCYISKLADFGYLVLVKHSEFNNEYFLRSLEPLNEKLTNSIITCIDSEKLRETEKAMYQQSKLASMGEMIANIAHQWRQPLNAISMSASSIQLHKQLGIFNEEELDRALNLILKQVDHLSLTIETFRNFFKPNKSKSNFNIKNTFEHILTIIYGELSKYHINVILKIDDDINTINYEQELMQAIINIINNAKDILNEKKVDNKLIVINVKKQENEIIIKILDNGGGIPDDIIHRIFEPYFTTKHQVQGTGIGLFMTEEIIYKHLNGRIFVQNKEFSYDNESYIGAEFTIILKDSNEYN